MGGTIVAAAATTTEENHPTLTTTVTTATTATMELKEATAKITERRKVHAVSTKAQLCELVHHLNGFANPPKTDQR